LTTFETSSILEAAGAVLKIGLSLKLLYMYGGPGQKKHAIYTLLHLEKKSS